MHANGRDDRLARTIEINLRGKLASDTISRRAHFCQPIDRKNQRRKGAKVQKSALRWRPIFTVRWRAGSAWALFRFRFGFSVRWRFGFRFSRLWSCVESASPSAADAGQHGGRRSAKARQTVRGGAFGSASRLISIYF